MQKPSPYGPAGYLESRVFFWKDWDDGPWQIELDFAEDAETGRIFCCGVAVRLRDGAEAIEMTATLLREVPLGAVVRWHLEQSALWANRLHEMSTSGPAPLGVDTFAELRDGYRAGISGPRGGRPPKHGAEHYKNVAKVYTDELARKKPTEGYADVGARKKPTEAVRVHPEWGPINYSLAAKWVATARRLGYLGTTTKGRAGTGVLAEPLSDAALYQRATARAEEWQARVDELDTKPTKKPRRPTTKKAVKRTTKKPTARKPTKKKGTR